MSDPAGEALGRAAAQWSRQRTARVGRWRVRYREAGRGEALVLVHGLAMSADYWWRNAPPLAAGGFRVIAPDLPGFGNTRGAPAATTIGLQARFLSQLCREMGIGRATFVGHSVSAQSVLRLAIINPALVQGLILAAPTGDPEVGSFGQALRLALDATREPWPLFPIIAKAYFAAGLPRYWRTWRAAMRDNVLETAPQVAAPALVVVGTRDPVVSRSFARRLAALLPAGEFSLVPGAAHALQFDAAEAFNQIVINTVAGAGTRPRVG